MKKSLKCPKNERFFNDEKTIVELSICLKNSARNNTTCAQVSIDLHLVKNIHNRPDSQARERANHKLLFEAPPGEKKSGSHFVGFVGGTGQYTQVL